MKIIKHMDWFGPSVTFSINSHDTYKTYCGGSLTISLVFSFLFLISFFGKDCFQKLHPEGFQKTVRNTDMHKNLKIEKDQFLIGFQIYDDNAKVFDFEDYFFPKFYYVEYKYKDGKYQRIEKNLKAMRCKESMIENFDKTHFNITNFLCPDISEITNLEGDWNSKEMKIINFQLHFCNKKKDKKFNECKDINLIKKKFEEQNIWISALIPKVNYVIDDFKKPFHLTLENYYNYIHPNKYVYDEIYLTKNEIEDDQGSFFEKIKFQEKSGISRILHYPLTLSEKSVISNENINENNNKIYSGYIYYDKDRILYSRKYQKLPDVLANVLGTLDLVMIFVVYFYQIYAKIRFEAYLFKRLIIVNNEKMGKMEGDRFDRDKNDLHLNNIDNNKVNYIFNNDGLSREEINNIKSKFLEKKNRNNNKNYDNYDKRFENNNFRINENKISKSQISKNENENALLFENKIKDKDIYHSYAEKGKNILFESNNDIFQELKNKYDRINSENNAIQNIPIELKNPNYLSNSYDSNKILKDNKENLKLPKEKVKKYFESKIEKFNSYKNKFKFNLLSYFKYSFYDKKNKKKSYSEIFDIFVNKMLKKIDIFYYLNKNAQMKIIKKALISKEQKNFIDLVTKKQYYMNDWNYGKIFEMENTDNKNLEFIFDKFEGKDDMNNFDEVILDRFIN